MKDLDGIIGSDPRPLSSNGPPSLNPPRITFLGTINMPLESLQTDGNHNFLCYTHMRKTNGIDLHTVDTVIFSTTFTELSFIGNILNICSIFYNLRCYILLLASFFLQ